MRNLYYVLTMLVIVVSALFVGGCSSDEYGNEEETTEAQVAALKTRVLEIAAEYGLDNYVVDDNLLRKNIGINDAQIEKELQMLASLSGTYSIKTDKGRIHLVKYRKGVHTRASDYPLTNEGNFSTHTNMGDSLTIDGSFDYDYHQDDQCSLNETFTVTDGDGNACNAEVVWSDTPMSLGDMDTQYVSGSYVIKVYTSSGVKYYEINCDYSHNSGGKGSATVREVSSTDARI